jgi:hypothetical protein
MVYPDNIDRGYFNPQLGARSDRRHYHLAHLQISPLSEPRSKSESPRIHRPAPPAGAYRRFFPPKPVRIGTRMSNGKAIAASYAP